MKLIPLTKNKFSMVDDEDFESLSRLRWHLAHGYASRTGKKGEPTNVTIHRVVMNAKPDDIVDHIDGDSLNNQKSNLRFCTKRENARNSKLAASNASGFKGVHLSHSFRPPRWVAQIKIPHTRKYLGNFKTPEDAARAYDTAAIEHHQEFANTNQKLGLL